MLAVVGLLNLFLWVSWLVSDTVRYYWMLERDVTAGWIGGLLSCVKCTDVLRAQSSLTTKLDAHVVAGHMYERNALTLRDLQTIQSLRDHPVKAAEELLDIISKQPDAVYLCFLDVLKVTSQQHIYQTLVQDGYKGQSYSWFRWPSA